MRKRTILIAAMIAALAVAVALALLFMRWAPPEPARLLPDGDGYIYVDLRPLRAAGLFKKLPAVKLEPEYEQFVKQTGIQFERDLDQAAIAVHKPGPGAELEARYSEVFVGRYDAKKLRAWLEQAASEKQQYRGVELFAIPLPGRTLRVAMLGPERVAASNAPTAEPIHAIIDHAKEFTVRLRGPQLLRDHYRQVPLGSVAWVIGRAGPTGDGQEVTLPGGFFVGLAPGTVVVASLRYSGDVELQVQAFAESEAEAQRLADQLGGYLALIRAITSGAQSGAAGEDLKKLFESVRLEKDGSRVVLSASASPELLEKIFAEAPQITAPQPPAEEKQPPKGRGR